MFYSTEDALRQGLDADYFTRQRWSSLREIFKDQCRVALYRKQFNLASMFATQGQFCREALQAKDILKDIKAIYPTGTFTGA